MALVIDLLVGLFASLAGGSRGPGMSCKIRPNQGIWNSARNAGTFALMGGLFMGLVLGLSGEIVQKLIRGLLFWGPLFGLLGGGSACIRHVLLRLVLHRFGYAPWNYAHFLNRVAEQLILQKVGGGYIFAHRMLPEHFAQQQLD